MIVRYLAAASLTLVLNAVPAFAQAPPADRPPERSAVASPATGVVVPADYVVGAEDVLGIMFWRDKDMSGDAVVRPDGKISLPLLNDVDVAGLTPEQVRERLTEAARKFVEDPSATVIVKQIKSRKVFITGNVYRPGPFPLLRETTVLQLIALAGGLQEFAKASDIVVVRMEGSRQVSYPFNYDNMKNGKNLAQNILLKPGDTVIVP